MLPTARQELASSSVPRRPGDLLRRLADVSATGSFSNSHRSRRFEAFAELVEDLALRLDRPVRILDIGGTNLFWEQRAGLGVRT